MKLSPPARAKLRELLDICIAQRLNAPAGIQLGATHVMPDSFRETKDLKDLVNIGGIRSIGLSLECLDLLENEDGLRYLDHKHLHVAVDALTTTIHKEDVKKLKTSAYVDRLINDFCQNYLREEHYFDIAFVIAGSLVIDTSLLPVGDGMLSRWTDKQIQEWGLLDEDSSDFVDRPVMVVSAQGVTVSVAIERARLSMEENLGVLRACIGYSTQLGSLLSRQDSSLQITSPSTTDLPEIYEQHLHFRPNGDFAVKEKGKDAPATFYRQEAFKVADISLDGQLHAYVTGALSYFNKFYSSKNAAHYPHECRRALEWIGSSITRPQYDDRVVDLCTALECVLSNSSDKRKAEALTVRQMVLSESLGYGPFFEVPHLVYDMYLMRNNIVHGSATRICNHNHAVRMMQLALSVMVGIAQLHDVTTKSFPKASKLIGYLDGQKDLIRKARSQLTWDFMPEAQRAAHQDNFSKATKETHGTLVAYIDTLLLPKVG